MIFKSAILAGVSTLFCIGAAQAHATFETKQAKVNSYYKAVVRVPHGCDGQATLKLRVEIPEGIISVRPQPKAGWQLETVKGDYAHTYTLHGKDITSGIKELVWTGSLEDEYFDEFVFQGRMTDKLPAGETLYVPVVQECADGQVAWTQIPAQGQDPHSLKHPAPGILIVANDEHHGHGDHGAAAKHEGHGDHSDHKDHANHSDHNGHDMAMGETVTVGDLTISNIRAKATLPGAPVAGGYLTIRNNGETADVLVGASASFAGKTEIHEMKMDGDVMKMNALPDGLEIPAGGEVSLKPGGYHVMFLKLNQGLKAGEQREVTLTFKNAGDVKINFDVVDMKAMKH